VDCFVQSQVTYKSMAPNAILFGRHIGMQPKVPVPVFEVVPTVPLRPY